MAGHHRGGRGVADMKFNTSGKLLTEGFFNDFMQWIFDIVQAGKGIRLEKGNGKIIISSDAVGGAVGGSAGVIPWVATLPAIPTGNSTQMVFWAKSTQITGGTGDGQIWVASTGHTAWKRIEGYSTLSGVPVEE